MRKAIGIACFGILLLIAGCGGGSSNGSFSEPTSKVSGVAFDGLVINADVDIYAFDGAKGELLASGKTNGVGAYTIALTAPSQPILIEVTNGHYEEEASNHIVQLEEGDRLQAVQFYVSGQPLQMGVTYFSTLAAGLAEYLVRDQGVTPANAVEVANERISGITGVDIARTLPLDVSDPENKHSSLSPELRYGFLTASLSQWTASASATNSLLIHQTVNSISFIQQAHADIRHDGMLNGIGQDGQLAFGAIDLTADVYRHELALSLMEYVASRNNATELSISDLRPAIETFNRAPDDIYDGVAVTAIDFSGTTVADFLPLENRTVFGAFVASATVLSQVGLQSVVFQIDGAAVSGEIGDLNRPALAIDSTVFVDGPHVLALVATNVAGQVTTVERNIMIENAAPTIVNIMPANGAQKLGTILLSADASHPLGIATMQFLIDGKQLAEPVITSKLQQHLNTATLADGNHVFSVIANASNGSTRRIDYTIATNNSAPVVSNVVPPYGTLVRGGFAASANASDLFGIVRTEFFLGGRSVGIAAVPTNPTAYIDSRNFNDGYQTLTVRATGAVTGRTSDGTQVIIVDNTAPAIGPATGPGTAPFRNHSPPQSCTVTVGITDNISPLPNLAVTLSRLTPTRTATGYQITGAPDCTPITVTATDQAGNYNERTIRICPRTQTITRGRGDNRVTQYACP
ncbi:MAG: Ig-like domain-containing protein [Gammaproteobacteria bacterium]